MFDGTNVRDSFEQSAKKVFPTSCNIPSLEGVLCQEPAEISVEI